MASMYSCGRLYTTTPTIVVGSKLYTDPRMRPEDIAPSSSYSNYYQYYTVTGTAGIVSSISNCPAYSGLPQTFTWTEGAGTTFKVSIVYPPVNVRIKVFGGTVRGSYINANYQVIAATPGSNSATIFLPTVGFQQTAYSYDIASYIGAINCRYYVDVWLLESGTPTGAYISVETY